MKMCIGSAKPHRTVFRFFERYYDAKEVIHKRISWNPENISKSGPKIRPKIVKNWIFDENVHRIRKTSEDRHFFERYYDAKEKIKKFEIYNENVRTVFRFFERYYDAKELIHQRISWNWENISKSGPKKG